MHAAGSCARTHTLVTSIEAWSTNYYVSLVSGVTDLFPCTLLFLSCTPMDRTVYGSHMTVDTFRYHLYVETAFMEALESFPMLLRLDDKDFSSVAMYELAF